LRAPIGAATSARRGTTPKARRLPRPAGTAFSALARKKPTTILEDVTVPRSTLATMVGVQLRRPPEEHDLQIGTFGHMGDGTCIRHVLDRRAAMKTRCAVCTTPFDAIFARALELGGTITGEHGVGLAKKAWLPKRWGDSSYELMRQVKRRSIPRPAQPVKDIQIPSCSTG